MEGSDMFDADKLSSFKKNELINLIKELQNEKVELKQQLSQLPDLKKQAEQMSGFENRLIELERSHALYLQYGRRNSVEITGVPEQVQQEDLESHVINIFKEAKVSVHGRSLEPFDMEACHRIGKRNVVIARFVNRKFAREALYNGRNLKGKQLNVGI